MNQRAEEEGRTAQERMYDLIWSYREDLGRYHDHKERMAFGATALYLAGGGALVIKGPEVWTDFTSVERCFAVVALGVTVVLTFLFVGWQLGMRRFASDMTTACNNLAVRWLTGNPTNEELVGVTLQRAAVVPSGSLWPRALADQYANEGAGGWRLDGPGISEALTYGIMLIWAVAVAIRLV